MHRDCFIVDGGLFLTYVCLPPFFQMMTWPDPILELKKNQ